MNKRILALLTVILVLTIQLTALASASNEHTHDWGSVKVSSYHTDKGHFKYRVCKEDNTLLSLGYVKDASCDKCYPPEPPTPAPTPTPKPTPKPLPDPTPVPEGHTHTWGPVRTTKYYNEQCGGYWKYRRCSSCGVYVHLGYVKERIKQE